MQHGMTIRFYVLWITVALLLAFMLFSKRMKFRDPVMYETVLHRTRLDQLQASAVQPVA
jgi:prolipoprotein diacylglyceryltransferase